MKGIYFLIALGLIIGGTAVAQEVGIGTTAPTVRLDIQAPATYTNDLLRVRKGGTTYLVVKNNGNVGIGTTTPSYKLHVAGGIYANGGWIRVSGNHGLYFQSYGGGWYMIDSTWMRSYNNKPVYSGGQIRSANSVRAPIFYDHNDSGYYLDPASPGKSLLVAGRVGIGTTTPSYKLHVAGGIYANGGWIRVSGNYGLYFQSYGGGWYMIDSTWVRSFDNKPVYSGGQIRSANSMRAPIFYDHNDSGYYLDPASPSTSLLVAGNVGIGTTAPTQKLDVNGRIRIRGGSPGAGKILQSDANGVGTWVSPSAISDGDWTVSGTNMYSAVSGNVGIGTTTPSYKLHVAGGIYASGGWVRVAGNNGLYFQSHGGGWYMTDDTWVRSYNNKPVYSGGQIRSANSMRAPIFYDHNDSGYYLDPASPGTSLLVAGNVGIGTTTPSYKLHVAGGIYASGGWVRVAGNNGLYFQSYGGGWYMTDNTWVRSYNNKPVYSGGQIRSANSMRAPIFYDHNDSGYYLDPASPGTSLLVAGKVGIGTTAPTQKLDVNGRIRIRGGSPGAGKILQSDANGVGTWVSPSAISDGDWTVSGTKMYSAVSGNVGIGTTNPSYKLHVAGDVYANGGWLRVSGTKGLYFQSYGGGWRMADATWIRNYGSKPLYITGNNTISAAFMSGRVGIGTTSPQNQLQIRNNSGRATLGLKGAGDIYDYANLLFLRTNGPTFWYFNFRKNTNDYRFSLFYSPSSGTYWENVAWYPNGNMRIRGVLSQGSDIKLKKDITPIHNALSLVTALKGVHYTLKQSNEPTFGFIAQEVEPILPDLVYTDSTSGLKSLNYIGIIPLVVEAIKEQQNQLSQLKSETIRSQQELHQKDLQLERKTNEIEALKKEMATLEARLAALENILQAQGQK